MTDLGAFTVHVIGPYRRYPGYKVRAVDGALGTTVTITAPNGDTHTGGSVQDAEAWMVAHSHHTHTEDHNPTHQHDPHCPTHHSLPHQPQGGTR